MNSTATLVNQAAPRIIVHSFETVDGATQPVKHSKPALAPVLATRRAHSKSRAGCARCKLRRIKCDERKPSCSRCTRGGCVCSYASVSVTTRPPSAQKPIQAPTSDQSINVFPSMACDTFSLQDMRFFHHFLVKARPHVPVGNAAVWVREISQLAHQHTFLMYAFLALGSTHLGRLVGNQSFQIKALTYRLKGLEGLRRATECQSWAHGRADSLIAAAYALMLQAAHIDDGLYDWLSLLRLALSISEKVNEDQQISTEFDLRPIHHYEYIAPYLHLLPPIHPYLLSSGFEALEKLSPNLVEPQSIAFCDSLRRTIQAHQASPQKGYLAFGQNFKFWLDLSQRHFDVCLNAMNGEMQLLLCYFLSLLLMTIPQGVIENHESMESQTSRHVVGMLGWMRRCLQNVPCRLKKHAKFVESMLESAIAETNGVPPPGPSVLQLEIAYDLHLKIKALQLGESSKG